MSKEIGHTVLEGEVVYSVEDHLRMTVTPEDLARVDEFMINVKRLLRGFYAVPIRERTPYGLRGAPPAPVERCQQHGNVFTRRTDLRRNPYVISLSKCSMSLHWGGDTLPSYGSTILFFSQGVKTEIQLTPASREGDA